MARSPRQPFRAPAVREILSRAWDADASAYRCEWLGHDGTRCETIVAYRDVRPKGAPQGALDHRAACWTASATPVAERPPLTADDGWMLCPTHHNAKSAREAREKARTDGAGKIYRRHKEAMASKTLTSHQQSVEGIRQEIEAEGVSTRRKAKIKSRGFQKRGEAKPQRPAYWAGD